MYEMQKLRSGLKVVAAPVKGTAAVTVLVFVGAGSRYERREERGISHFLEHMFFKGGEKYPDAASVSIAIDSVGGDFNAFTGKEYAGYYVKTASQHTGLACEVLSDMLLKATFPQHEIEKERGVIIEEYRMYQDTPMYQAGWDFETLMFGDQPLGWDTIGTEEVIRSVNQIDFQSHKHRFYTPDNTVVVFAGNITAKHAFELGEKFFGELDGSKQREFIKVESLPHTRIAVTEKGTEQAHLVYGVAGVPAESDLHFAQKLLSIILGGSMSSRMFLNVREARGLCYYISTSTDSYKDAGILSTRAGVDSSRLEEAITAIGKEYDAVQTKGITVEELNRAKSYLKGKVTLSMEDSEERAHFIGKQFLMYKDIRDLDQYFKEVDAVTLEDINTLAAKIFVPEQRRLVVIGKGLDAKKLESLLG